MPGPGPGDGVRAIDVTRESLRDIEICLSAQASKHCQMGFRRPVRRSTLADAVVLKARLRHDGMRAIPRQIWRIDAEFAQRLIVQARTLHAGTDLGLDLANSVYALARRRPTCVCRCFPGRTSARPRPP